MVSKNSVAKGKVVLTVEHGDATEPLVGASFVELPGMTSQSELTFECGFSSVLDALSGRCETAAADEALRVVAEGKA